MSMGNKKSSSFIQNLPPEILTIIFGNLTIFELAEVQKTCKAWHAIAQKTPTLWRKSAPFFKKYEENLWEISEFVQGVQTLSRLSAGKLDEISFNFLTEVDDVAEIASFLESIPDLNPTSLRFRGILDSDTYFPIIGRCKSLRELDLEIWVTPYKNNVLKDSPIQEAKLEKLTLNQDSLEDWAGDESCLSVSSCVKTLILDMPHSDTLVDEIDVVQTLDFLYHCRQSVESLFIMAIGVSTLRRGGTGLHREIVFPNLIKASFTLWDEVSRTDDELIPFHCFKCPQIQELDLPSKYFLKLFDSVESVKDVKIDWPVDDLAEIFRIFPNIETFEAYLGSQDMLRSLVDLVPKQLKHLNLTVGTYGRYDDSFRMNPNKRATIDQLLELVRHSSAKQYRDTFLLQQDGEIEYCKIDVIHSCNIRKRDYHHMVHYSMCKRNFVEIFTKLSKMQALDTNSFISTSHWTKHK